jgi:predicted Zn-ribbon and HTH transcriptional regulator
MPIMLPINLKSSVQVYFVLCEKCYWCASIFNTTRANLTKCPSCYSHNIEFIPICSKEVYKFDYSTKSGVTLEFGR